MGFGLLHIHMMVNKWFYSLIGNYLASGSDDKTIKIWKMSDFFNVKTLTGHTNKVLSVAYSPDGFKNEFIN